MNQKFEPTQRFLTKSTFFGPLRGPLDTKRYKSKGNDEKDLKHREEKMDPKLQSRKIQKQCGHWDVKKIPGRQINWKITYVRVPIFQKCYRAQ